MVKLSRNYKDLIVWQRSLQLVVEVYRFTSIFPSSELYGLTSQMLRASVSIASNIAEGSKRGTRKDFRSFLMISSGSAAELETQFEIVKLLPFGKKLDVSECESLIQEVIKMLHKLISTLNV